MEVHLGEYSPPPQVPSPARYSRSPCPQPSVATRSRVTCQDLPSSERRLRSACHATAGSPASNQAIVSFWIVGSAVIAFSRMHRHRIHGTTIFRCFEDEADCTQRGPDCWPRQCQFNIRGSVLRTEVLYRNRIVLPSSSMLSRTSFGRRRFRGRLDDVTVVEEFSHSDDSTPEEGGTPAPKVEVTVAAGSMTANGEPVVGRLTVESQAQTDLPGPPMEPTTGAGAFAIADRVVEISFSGVTGRDPDQRDLTKQIRFDPPRFS